MRKFLILITVTLALIHSAGSVAAQAPRKTPAGSSEFRTPVLPSDQLPREAPSLRNRILTGLAGAALGAGVGYFASQVATGDWEKRAGQGGVHRPSWAAVGGAGGLVLGLSLPLGGRRTGSTTPFPFESDRFTITRVDIQEAMVMSALEAVRFFHPEWLNVRGQETFDGPGNDDVRAYLDNVPLGDVDALAGVETSLIEYILFFDSRKATARWGMSHPHGAIQVVTLGGESTH